MNLEKLLLLDDQTLAEAFDILVAQSWVRDWGGEKHKADTMKNIIKGDTQPCQPFENFVKCIEFLSSPHQLRYSKQK